METNRIPVLIIGRRSENTKIAKWGIGLAQGTRAPRSAYQQSRGKINERANSTPPVGNE